MIGLMLHAAFRFIRPNRYECPMMLPCHDHPPWPIDTWPITDEDLRAARRIALEHDWIDDGGSWQRRRDEIREEGNPRDEGIWTDARDNRHDRA